jgi:hypothetical protein
MLAGSPVILGRRVLPFSVCHSMILHAAENPYWFGRECRPEDLIEAVMVCSRTWEQNRERFAKDGRREARRLAARLYLRKEFQAAHEAFAAYLNDACDVTARELPDTDGGRELVAPWQFRIVPFLMRHGMSESEAWNCPVNRARCYLDATAEEAGDAILCDGVQENAYALIVEANKLAAAGQREQADELYNRAQAVFDRKSGASDALRKALK